MKRRDPAPEKRVIQPHKPALLKRLNRIEGQVRGVARMVEADRYCVDIIIQLAAVRAALNAVALHLLEDHTRGCVLAAIKSNQGETVIDELTRVMRRYAR